MNSIPDGEETGSIHRSAADIRCAPSRAGGGNLQFRGKERSPIQVQDARRVVGPPDPDELDGVAINQPVLDPGAPVDNVERRQYSALDDTGVCYIQSPAAVHRKSSRVQP